KKQINDLNAENGKQLNQINSLKDENYKQAKQMDDLKEEKKEQKKQVDSLKDENNKQMGQLKNLEKENEKHISEMNVLRKEITQHLNQIDNFKDENNKQNNAFKEKIEQHLNRINKKDGKEQNEQVNRLKQEKDKQMERVKCLEKNNKKQKKQVGCLKEKNNKQMEQVKCLKEENDKQMEQVKCLQKENEKQTTENSILKRENEQQMEQINKLTDEKQKLQTQVDDTANRNEQLTSENAKQRDELYKHQDQIQQLESNVQMQKVQLDNTKAKLVPVVEYGLSGIEPIQVSKIESLHQLIFFDIIKSSQPNINLIAGKQKSNYLKAFVGIDFGTDGTAFAYGFSGGKVYIGQKWPGQLLAELKNKTNILLDKDGRFVAFGQEAADKYTSNTDRSLEFYENFTMALYGQTPNFFIFYFIINDTIIITITDKTFAEVDKKCGNEEKERDLELYLTAANGKKRRILDVLVQAFKFMQEHIMEILKDTILVEKIEDVQWVVSVPAIWSNTAKNRMKEATILAGLINGSIPDHLMIASEPGVIHFNNTGSPLQKKKNRVRKEGTADITCHQILDEIHVLQIYPPSGGPWGSTYIDEAFWKMLCEIFGNEIMQELKRKHPTKFIQLMKHFRQVKHGYYSELEEAPMVKLHELVDFMDEHDIDMDTMSKKVQAYKLENKSGVFEFDKDIGVLYLGHEGWKFLMDKIMDPLIHHVHKLLMEPQLRGCQTLLCTGEFSTLPYVIQRLRDVLVRDHKIITTITKPEYPILAVVEGATLFGMAPSIIVEYILEHTYGLKCARDWIESDGEEGKIWNKENGKYIFEDEFEIFARKNTEINVHNPPIVKCFQPLNRDAKKITIEIHCSDKKIPNNVLAPPFCASQL
ncbi:hypothetical protein RFI_28642, partial [Reticulomyxa filosa]